MRHTTINKSYKLQLADLFNVSEDYVSKVLRGVRHNKAITDAYELFIQQEQIAAKKITMNATKKVA